MKKVEEHFQYVSDIMNDIDLSKKTILTGFNGSGKSLIASQLQFRVKEEFKHNLIHTSMRLRTDTNPSMGALAGIGRDCNWLATSYNTISSIKTTINMVLKNNHKYIVIDEPEIGIGDELLLGLIDHLNERFDEFTEKGIGCLIVTHRKDVVNMLKKDAFFNLGGLTEEEWLNRPITKKSIEDFEKESSEFFNYIKSKSKN